MKEEENREEEEYSMEVSGIEGIRERNENAKRNRRDEAMIA